MARPRRAGNARVLDWDLIMRDVRPFYGPPYVAPVHREPTLAPRWEFHLVALFPALVLLWLRSGPGREEWLFGYQLLVFPLTAVVWAGYGVRYAVQRLRPRPVAGARWFLVAPAMALLVGLLLVTHAPLRARWAASSSSFERARHHAPAVQLDHAWHQFGGDHTVGLYHVHFAYRIDDVTVFVETAHGGILSGMCGFVHLPGNETLPADWFPTLRHLNGSWYSWCGDAPPPLLSGSESD